MEDGKQPLRLKARGKVLMMSDFLMPRGRLAALPLPRRYATEYFVYKYWRGDDMVDHTVKVAFPILMLHFLAVRLSLV